MLKQVFVRVKGHVIGVGFRAWVSIQAKKLKLNGWVRNVYDQPDVFGLLGGVEALFQGEEEDISKIYEVLKNGPGHVEEIETIPQVVKEIFSSFKIIK